MTEMKNDQVTAAWLDYREAARYSSLGRTKLTQLVTSGAVKAAKVGRAVRISRASLDAYLEANSYVDFGQDQ